MAAHERQQVPPHLVGLDRPLALGAGAYQLGRGLRGGRRPYREDEDTGERRPLESGEREDEDTGERRPLESGEREDENAGERRPLESGEREDENAGQRRRLEPGERRLAPPLAPRPTFRASAAFRGADACLPKRHPAAPLPCAPGHPP